MLNGVPRILIVRLSAIGDVVRVLPALHALRDRYPTAQIDWAIETKSADVVAGHPAIDQVLIFDRTRKWRADWRNFRGFCRMIRARRYDIVLDFHGIFKSGWIARASKAPDRYGFARPRSQELSWLFTNHKVELHSMRMNRIEENLELCKLLDAKTYSLDVYFPIPLEVLDEIDDYIEGTFQGGKRLVAIHAPVDRPEKQWPPEHFSKLSDLLLADGRFDVVLTWGPGQRAVADAVSDQSRRHPKVAPELPTLKHLAGLLQRMNLVFAGDTGPMHIASAVGTPVVGLFGGTDPAKHAPLRQPSEVLYAGPANPPNVLPCKEAEDYLRRITPEMAYDACVRVAMAR
jgi:lipopolysaccharide heptosyltransferase I